MLGVENDVMNTITERQIKWYVHMRRIKEVRIPLKVWTWEPAERRKKWKP